MQAAFKPLEILLLSLGLFGFAILLVSTAENFLMMAANYIWLPFLLALILLFFKNAGYSRSENNGQKQSKRMQNIFSMWGAFICLAICYFGFWQGFLVYQPVFFDPAGEAVYATFAYTAQLIWLFKMMLIAWIPAACIALYLYIHNQTQISSIFIGLLKVDSRYRLVIDSIASLPLLLCILMILSVAGVEMTRSIMAVLGFERPIFPELTAIILVIAIVSGYFLFRLKLRHEKLAKQSASLGRMYAMQLFYLVVLLLIGQAIIQIFPLDMMLPLMAPIYAIMPSVGVATIWIFATMAIAVLSIPLLAHYMASCLESLKIWQAAVILVVPIVAMMLIMNQYLPSDMFEVHSVLSFIPRTELVPIGVDNVIYQVGYMQWLLFIATGIFFACLSYSQRVQQAFSDMMPMHLSKRLYRVRALIARVAILLIFLCVFYLLLSAFGYFYFIMVFFTWVTLGLLLVGFIMLYNLTFR